MTNVKILITSLVTALSGGTIFHLLRMVFCLPNSFGTPGLDMLKIRWFTIRARGLAMDYVIERLI